MGGSPDFLGSKSNTHKVVLAKTPNIRGLDIFSLVPTIKVQTSLKCYENKKLLEGERSRFLAMEIVRPFPRRRAPCRRR